jgi:hypothetical protein
MRNVIVAATIIVGMTSSTGLSQNRAPSTIPIVTRIDFSSSYSARRGEVFSFKNKFYEVSSEAIKMDTGSTNRVLCDEEVARDIENAVESGILTNRPIDTVAVKIRPVEVNSKMVSFVVKRGNDLFSLYDESGSAVLEDVGRERIVELGIAAKGKGAR